MSLAGSLETKKSIVFLHTSNAQSEMEIKKIFKILSIYKALRDNLTYPYVLGNLKVPASFFKNRSQETNSKIYMENANHVEQLWKRTKGRKCHNLI